MSLSSKSKILTAVLLLALAGGAVVHLLPGEDPVLTEICKYQNDDNEAMQRALAQMEAIIQGESVETPDDRGYTPLMNAAQAGAEQIVDYLLIKGARLQTESPDGKTALSLTRDEGIRDLLLACEIAETVPSEDDKVALRKDLHEAGITTDDLNQAIFDAARTRRGNATILTAKVLALGGNANATDAEGTPVLQVQRWQENSVVLLLRHGAAPNGKLTSRGGSEILLTYIDSNVRNARNLLTAKAAVNDPDILARAAGAGCASILRQLLELGADPNATTSNGFSILEYCIQGRARHADAFQPAGLSECARLLLEAGAHPEITSKSGRLKSPISPGGISIQPECLQALVDAGANVNALNSRGANYAHIAAYKDASWDNLKLLKKIISRGADLAHKDDKGETFLFYALPTLCSIDILAENKDEQKAAMELLHQYLTVIKDAEPAPGDLDRNGNTALHLAVIRRGPADAKVVEFLLNMGVDPGVRNQFGRTALEALLLSPHGPSSADAARLLRPVSPEPVKLAERIKLAALLGNDAELPGLLAEKPDEKTLHTALLSTRSTAIMEALLNAGCPLYFETYEHLARYGCADIVPVLQKLNKLERMEAHWNKVCDYTLANALLKAGLRTPSASEIATTGLLEKLIQNNQIDINGAELNLRYFSNAQLPLPALLQNNDVEKARLLLESGAAVNGYLTPLLCQVADEELARMLVERGCRINDFTPEGENALSSQKSKLRTLAEEYELTRDSEVKEVFRRHLGITRLLENAGAQEASPRRNEVKRALQSPQCQEEYETFEFVTPAWQGRVRISRDSMVMARASGNTDTANIIELTRDYIIYKWDRWGYAAAVLRSDGKYHETLDLPRYQDFKADPQNHPHFYVRFINDEGSEETLYLHPDLRYAVRSGNLAGGTVEQISRGYSTPSILLSMDDGKKLKLVQIENKFHVLNSASAKKLLFYYKPIIPYQEIEAVGPSWQDKIRISTEYMVAKRCSKADTASVSEMRDNRLVLKWDRWSTESFTRRADGKYYSDSLPSPEGERIRQLLRENSPTLRSHQLILVHPLWTDAVRISVEHHIAVRASGRQDAARVISFSSDSITIKWDAFKEETYERGADGRFYKKNP